MCRVLGVSRSGYYAFCRRRPSRRALANVRILEEIRRVHRENHQTYGSPRVHAELKARGIACGRHRVGRLMRTAGIAAKMRRRYRTTTRARTGARYAPDRVQRNFVASRLHEVWTSDITYIWTSEGWLYLAVVLDLLSRVVVGWATGIRINAELVCDAVRSAIVRYRPHGEVIFHSDRGSQYTSDTLKGFLKEQMVASQITFLQSHGASCYDNAVTESLFHSLKTEWVCFEHYETRRDGHDSVFKYFETFYNRTRRNSSLGYLSPSQKMDNYINEKA